MPDCPLTIICYFTLSRYMPSPFPAVYFKSCSHCGWYPVSSADLCGEQAMFFRSDGPSSYCARNSNKRNFAGFGGWRGKHEPQVSLYGVGMKIQALPCVHSPRPTPEITPKTAQNQHAQDCIQVRDEFLSGEHTSEHSYIANGVDFRDGSPALPGLSQ